MRVLVLAWEPLPVPRVPVWPRLRAVVRGLATQDVGVDVVADAATLARAEVEGCAPLEAPPFLDHADVRTSVLAGGVALQTAAATCAAAADVVLAVGWQATHGAVHVARVHDRPVVGVLLSLRPPSRSDVDVAFAHQVRWWLAYESRIVVCASDRLRGRVASAYRVPRDKLVTAALPLGAHSPVDHPTLGRDLHAALDAAHRRTAPRAALPTTVPERLRLDVVRSRP